MQDDSVFILLIATYEIPGVCSVLPMSIHALDSVNPWLLWIVITQASFKGSCCLSFTPLIVSEATVIGHIGTQCGISLLIDGPGYSSNFTITAIGRSRGCWLLPYMKSITTPVDQKKFIFPVFSPQYQEELYNDQFLLSFYSTNFSTFTWFIHEPLINIFCKKSIFFAHYL